MISAGLMIDLDGVVYDGDSVVPGAASALAWLAEKGVPRIFVTNTTSRPRSALVDKLASMDIAVSTDEILTPPVAAVRWLEERDKSPVALFVPEATRSEFAALEQADCATDRPVAAVVVGDYGEGWDFGTMNRAFRLLMERPEPDLVALGMTRYWRAADGLRLDTGPFVKALAYASGAEPVIMGKPGREFFESAASMLGVPSASTFMVGDDMLTDIDAAQKQGMGGILVQTGKFRLSDLESGVTPRAVLPSLAALPDWWQAQEN